MMSCCNLRKYLSEVCAGSLWPIVSVGFSSRSGHHFSRSFPCFSSLLTMRLPRRLVSLMVMSLERVFFWVLAIETALLLHLTPWSESRCVHDAMVHWGSASGSLRSSQGSSASHPLQSSYSYFGGLGLEGRLAANSAWYPRGEDLIGSCEFHDTPHSQIPSSHLRVGWILVRQQCHRPASTWHRHWTWDLQNLRCQQWLLQSWLASI